ncbi:tRNA lysidine(34) synthetase TilS [Pseudonocardia endophytica]|uniref:tRNA(Ile)-lysidine synthase n=1 Tax=Pseudonocardia endophytica TaxID=401976 RepID=A0A4R1HD39_PSEEN|nr:tRNA lysidine(34) synthetase TilS [Pseudonocardia endophytica]TCK19957.1 tRNA(Ile)-lysidine synthase [Pseudonocardia endophytica]
MTGPPGPASRRVRTAVRRALDGLPEPVRAAPVLVACSGGADSSALLDAARALRPGRVHAAVVDHGLQDGSDARSAALVERIRGLGVEAAVHTVRVDGRGGIEAAARDARYGALRDARPHPDSPVLLGHTVDDQAETVLLGLGRGSGARSLAGMRAWSPPWLRPLLGVRRACTVDACAENGTPVWDDPHNVDPRFTRARLRHEVLPLLDDVLGGGVAEALARTASQLRDDDEALSGWAAGVHSPGDPHDSDRPPDGQVIDHPDGVTAVLPVAALTGLPPAVRRRVLREWLRDGGARALTDEHLRAADDLVGRWRGQGGPALGGDLDLVRTHGRLELRRRERGS